MNIKNIMIILLFGISLQQVKAMDKENLKEMAVIIGGAAIVCGTFKHIKDHYCPYFKYKTSKKFGTNRQAIMSELHPFLHGSLYGIALACTARLGNFGPKLTALELAKPVIASMVGGMALSGLLGVAYKYYSGSQKKQSKIIRTTSQWVDIVLPSIAVFCVDAYRVKNLVWADFLNSYNRYKMS